jgi:hypothetical protein
MKRLVLRRLTGRSYQWLITGLDRFQKTDEVRQQRPEGAARSGGKGGKDNERISGLHALATRAHGSLRGALAFGDAAQAALQIPADLDDRRSNSHQFRTTGKYVNKHLFNHIKM